MQKYSLPYLIVLAVVFIGTLWDGFTTLYGAYVIFRDEPWALQNVVSLRDLEPRAALVALIFALLLLAFLLLARPILQAEMTPVATLLKFCLALAIGYDLFTSWLGNAHFLFRQQPTENVLLLDLFLLGLTVFVSACTLLTSFLVLDSSSRLPLAAAR